MPGRPPSVGGEGNQATGYDLESIVTHEAGHFFGLAYAETHSLFEKPPTRDTFQGVRHSTAPNKVGQYLSHHSLVKL